MGRPRDLSAITTTRLPQGRTGRSGGMAAAGTFRCVTTNVAPEHLPPAAAMGWAGRARVARAAMSAVEMGPGGAAWRNHPHLQFLTHRLRSHLSAAWRARGERRPVEEILRDLQEVHRVTLTVDGEVVRRLATHPPKAVAEMLTRLELWPLFGVPEEGKAKGVA